MAAVIQPDAGEVFLAAWSAVADPAATALALGPLPALHTLDFIEADPAVRRAVILLAGLHWSFVAGPAQRRDLREAGLDVHAGDRTTWRLLAARPSRAQIEQWRAEPRPMAGAVA